MVEIREIGIQNQQKHKKQRMDHSILCGLMKCLSPAFCC